MFELVYSPPWFYGKDLVIDLLATTVLFLIGFFSLRYYRINPERKTHLYLAISFFLISLSFLFKIATNFTIYYDVDVTHTMGGMMYSYELIRSSDVLFFIGTVANRVLMLVGLYSLYSIYHEHSKSEMVLAIYLLVVVAIFTHSNYYIFHLTGLILLLLITIKYIQKYKQNNNLSTKYLAISFGIITLSHVLFSFVTYSQVLYVAAELVQLAGFVVMLTVFFRVLKNGKKKRPA